MRLTNLVVGGELSKSLGGKYSVKTYAEAQQEVIAEDKLTTDVNPTKERSLRILCILLGIGIVILIAGVVLLLIH